MSIDRCSKKSDEPEILTTESHGVLVINGGYAGLPICFSCHDPLLTPDSGTTTAVESSRNFLAGPETWRQMVPLKIGGMGELVGGSSRCVLEDLVWMMLETMSEEFFSSSEARWDETQIWSMD